MKRTIGVLLSLVFIFVFAYALADVAIDETNFPDDTFRENVEYYDTNGDGMFSNGEPADVTEIYCAESMRSQLILGPQNNTLEDLDCSRNQLKKLDVSSCSAFVTLVKTCQPTEVGSNMVWYRSYVEDAARYLLIDKDVTIITGDEPLVPAGVEINETNFPDENFRAVVQGFDTDVDGYLSDEETASVQEFDCSGFGCISDLSGIEYFTAIEVLHCGYNELTNLDVSKNTMLLELYCYNNQLVSLDLSNNTALKEIECYNNALKNLDISNSTALLRLDCSSNSLTNLDVSKSTALQILCCYSNRLTSLDVSNNTVLTSLGCSSNQLTSLNVSGNTELQELYCHTNKLTKLDISKNKALTKLECCWNSLKKLDVSAVPKLNSLVKETDPKDENGYFTWGKDEDRDGLEDAVLIVDKTVQVITDKAESIDIGKAKVTAIKAQVYTGKAIKPAVVVKYDGKKLTKDTDYTLTYKNNKKIGKATVTIIGKGDYTGKKTVKFDIIPKTVKLFSLTAGKKQLTVKWAKGSGITGYEIEYSLKKDFKTKKSVIIKKASTTKTVLKKLQAKTTYYVRIRAYKTVGGKKYYSAWSEIKNKKTK